ncbi:MAG: site-2 protease family protein [Proteobacteria bacterium]|nr:site-2 protease family protein [Pseudomonadota bacterium]
MEETIKKVALFALPFLFSLCFHEYAHAWVANKLGDPTAKYNGRLTLNPLAHIDWLWTVIIPTITLIVGGIYFGSAKPVPIDSRNFKNPEKGMAAVAVAGPFSNIILGFLFAILLVSFTLFFNKSENFFSPVSDMLQAGILINFFLAFFNLIPLPPLDGSRILTMFLPYRKAAYLDMFAPYSFILILLLWQVGILNYIIATPALLLYKLSITLSYNILTGFM